ncbi:Parvovirus coat protein VP1-like protein [Ornithinibacillus sp. BX22]|uniref:Parvovirus coat protein VP1-like protein n=1 Tax=Ornithinibacillus hominis TaxID=2763055 RepID=A0A923L483_9BACI|nr:Parvovirus coat protein VP1-like protein [Ornithinibacillus hominis]MBC5636100.1 Parvovirus coat protein VP1-like protein [Ornithinibacillus hominis]
MICLPGYRYCGPGCSGPGAPTNKLDYFCLQHDQCYQRGLPRRLCDEQFLRQLAPYMTRRDKLGRDARLMYRVISFKLGF